MGGVVNTITKSGSNDWHGTGYWFFRNRSLNARDRFASFNPQDIRHQSGVSLGGPIKKDKLWYFASARNFVLDTLPANTFIGQPNTATPYSAPLASNEIGVDPQSIRSIQARITWQISQKNKLAIYNDRLLKNRGSAMTAGFDPATAGIVWNSPIYSTGSVKFSSTVSPKIYFESGFSTNYERYNTIYQPGLAKTPFTPEWYTQINKNDTGRGTQWNAGSINAGMYPDRFSAAASVSYVTGTHNVKVGIQDTWGRYRQFRSANGDIRANFINGVPATATILNTPLNYQDNLKADLGIYAQDSWTFKRLTVNYGARWEYFASGVPEETSGVGRFVATARTFGPIDMPAWKSISPRGGVVYDLFGNQKTALKFSLGKFMQAGTTGFSNRYNPLQLTMATVAWKDANADGIPQGELGCVYDTPGCEINLAQLPNGFGVASLANFDANIKRMYNVETALSVQHELLPRISVTGGWYHRDFKNLRRRDNTLQTFADYTPFTAYSPIDGSPIQYYNVTLAKRAAVNYVDRTAGSDRKMWFNGFEYNFNARLPRGASLFGGGMSEKVIAQVCDEQSNPNLLLYCDQTKSGIPFRTQFKLAGNVPIKYGIQVGFSIQSLPGYGYGTGALSGREGGPTGPTGQPSATQLNTPNGAGTVWLITPATTYTSASPCVGKGTCTAGQLVDPGMTVASLSIPLIAPNTEFGDRINQVDLNISKTIKVGKVSVQPKFDLFNALNVSPVYAVRGLNYGTAAYLQPSSILVGRVFQLGAIVKF